MPGLFSAGTGIISRLRKFLLWARVLLAICLCSYRRKRKSVLLYQQNVPPDRSEHIARTDEQTRPPSMPPWDVRAARAGQGGSGGLVVTSFCLRTGGGRASLGAEMRVQIRVQIRDAFDALYSGLVYCSYCTVLYCSQLNFSKIKF